MYLAFVCVAAFKLTCEVPVICSVRNMTGSVAFERNADSSDTLKTSLSPPVTHGNGALGY